MTSRAPLVCSEFPLKFKDVFTPISDCSIRVTHVYSTALLEYIDLLSMLELVFELPGMLKLLYFSPNNYTSQIYHSIIGEIFLIDT